MKNFGGYFDPESKEERIKVLENKTIQPDFWSNNNESSKIIQELNSLRNSLNKFKELKEKIKNNLEIISIMDDEIKSELENDINEIENSLNDWDVLLTLNGPYDKGNAIIEIHSGAGGTEACDWANMLKRMYFRWCEKKNYKIE